MSAESNQNGQYVPLKIPQNQFSTMTNVNEMHEFIKANPNILDKNASTTQHITINKIYTDKNGISMNKDDDDNKYEIEYSEKSKNKNKNKNKIKMNIKKIIRIRRIRIRN